MTDLLDEKASADEWPRFATGGVIRDADPTPIGDGAYAIPAFVTCGCGRDLHITVSLSAAQIEAAVSRVLVGMQRQAAQSSARRASIGS